MEKIFLTGVSGFVGKSIFKKLSKKYDIYAPERKDLDLLNLNQLKVLMLDQKFDWIINCAVKGGRRTKKDTSEDFFNNIASLDNLLNFVNSDCKLITFSSGAEVHKQNDFYGLSKKICSSIVRDKKNIKNLRIYNIFGELGMYDSFIFSTILKALQGETIIIWEDIEFDTYYIEDLINLIELLIKESSQDYEEIDCVYSKKDKLSEIAILIKKICESNSIIITENQGKISYTGKFNEIKGLKLTKLENSIEQMVKFIKNEKL